MLVTFRCSAPCTRPRARITARSRASLPNHLWDDRLYLASSNTFVLEAAPARAHLVGARFDPPLPSMFSTRVGRAFCEHLSMRTFARTTRKAYVLLIFRSGARSLRLATITGSFVSRRSKPRCCRLAVDPVPLLKGPRFYRATAIAFHDSRLRFCRRRVRRVFALPRSRVWQLFGAVIVREAAAIVFVPVFFDVHARSPAFVRLAVCFRRGDRRTSRGRCIGSFQSHARSLFIVLEIRDHLLDDPVRSWTQRICFDLAASIQIRFERHLMRTAF